MASPQLLYRARAAESERAADAATLANVRDRFRASQLSWTLLADRAEEVEDMRERLLAEKQAERVAAETGG